MSQFIIALIRTVVPAAVGSLFGWLASVGLALDAGTQGGLVLALIAFFTGLYYAAVTWLAARWKWFGWLLGVAATPVYDGSGSPSVGPGVVNVSIVNPVTPAPVPDELIDVLDSAVGKHRL